MTVGKRKSVLGVFGDKKNLPQQVIKAPAESGLKGVLFRLNEPAKKQLDIMAAELDRRKQDLLCEAVNDLFQKYNKERIA